MGENVIYYTDELNDDFSGLSIHEKPLGERYQYVHTNWFFKIFEFLFYYGVMIPVVYMLEKVFCHQKFANRHVLKQAKKEGCFLIGNHTQVQSDSYVGPLATFPKKCFIVSHPQVLSVPFLCLGMQAYGVIPLGSTLDEKKAFLQCLEKRVQDGHAVMIYPEAHVWPFYTKIRPFDEQCFWYPVTMQKPMYVLTNCYQKRRFFKRPQIVTYVDGPFYPNENLSRKEAAKELRDIAYNTMCKRVSEHTTCEYIRYVKAEPTE